MPFFRVSRVQDSAADCNRLCRGGDVSRLSTLAWPTARIRAGRHGRRHGEMRALRREPAAQRSHLFRRPLLLHPRAPATRQEMTAAATPMPRPTTPGYFASHWRSLDYFNLYRLTLAAALVFSGLLFSTSELFRLDINGRFQSYAFAYLIIAALFVLGIRARWPGFQIQLTAHITTDIVLFVLMMSTSDQLAGGLGLLLAISVASGGLVGSGRLTLLYAAMASIAILLQHGFNILGGGHGLDRFFQVGLLCAGYFAIGLLAHALTRRALHSERLAQQPADELALLNRINALAIENSPDGLLAVRGDGVVRHASPRAAALLGLAQPVAPDVTRLDACSPDLARLAQPLQPGETSILDTLAGQLRVRSIPLGTPDGSRVLVLEDQSQAEAAAQRLKLAALGRLTANIAHEIRNPLSAISHAAQLLHEDVDNPAQTRLLASVLRQDAVQAFA